MTSRTPRTPPGPEAFSLRGKVKAILSSEREAKVTHCWEVEGMFKEEEATRMFDGDRERVSESAVGEFVGGRRGTG